MSIILIETASPTGVALLSIFGILLGSAITAYVGWVTNRNTNMQNAKDKEALNSKTKEEATDIIIARYKKDNDLLAEHETSKDKIIAALTITNENLTKKLLEKDEAEKSYLAEIQKLRISVDRLQSKVTQLLVINGIEDDLS
jgi:uncharacterized protein (UPF0333 family)